MSAEAPPPAPLLETVTTTRDADGSINCAAMGVRFESAEEVVLWPFQGTRTLRNLRARGDAVVHLTDDVLLFVRAALEHPQPPMRAAGVVDGAVIAGVAAWSEVRVTEITETSDGLPRCEVRARVLAAGRGEQPPAGLCRARHAVVEASILASRVRWLGADAVAAGLVGLGELVDKTGGPDERAALAVVRDHLARAGAA